MNRNKRAALARRYMQRVPKGTLMTSRLPMETADFIANKGRFAKSDVILAMDSFYTGVPTKRLKPAALNSIAYELAKHEIRLRGQLFHRGLYSSIRGAANIAETSVAEMTTFFLETIAEMVRESIKEGRQAKRPLANAA